MDNNLMNDWLHSAAGHMTVTSPSDGGGGSTLDARGIQDDATITVSPPQPTKGPGGAS